MRWLQWVDRTRGWARSAQGLAWALLGRGKGRERSPIHRRSDSSDGTAAAAERGGPQAFHEGLPIQSSKTQRQPHRCAPKLVAWRPAEPFGRSATHAYVSDSESLALFAREGVYAAGMVLSTATPAATRTRARATGSGTLVPTRPHIPPPSSRGSTPRESLLACWTAGDRSGMGADVRTETSVYARAGTELRAPSSELSESAACAPHRSGFTGRPTAIETAPGRRSIKFPPRRRPFASRFDLQCP